MPKEIHVVGAVIISDGLVMCVQRGPERDLPGLWEFPGGKIEPRESSNAALVREVQEELGCVVEVGPEVTTTTHEYEFGVVILTTFYCRLVDGLPTLTEHASIKWLRPDELDSIPWTPADVPAVQIIRAKADGQDRHPSRLHADWPFS